MPPADIARAVVAVVFTAILGLAALSDIRTRKIPNWTVLAILALFAPWAALHWGLWVAWALVAGAVSLAIGIGVYAAGVIGAGDAKLFAAAALFVGLGRLGELAVVTALAGGLAALLSVAMRPREAVAALALGWKGAAGRGVAYGAAIAAGAAFVVWTALLNLPLGVLGL
jgi:prepilin peptidase CpaA